jgi:methylenetetrahydrofolate reductase (NADPH)
VYGAVHGQERGGDHHPGAVIDRMAKAAKGSEEGIKICVEQIQEVREIEGVHGVHIMAIE